MLHKASSIPGLNRRSGSVPASLIAAAVALTPMLGWACGGFFCSSQPVDQQAERVMFVQQDANEWSVYVEILYDGDAESFAWVVPVPEAPELDTWYSIGFSALDQATQPIFQVDWGCFGEPEAFAGAADDGDAQNAAPPADPAVEVLAREDVGPFETATVKSEDPRALVEWLRQNGFRIVPEMEPFIALYTEEGMAFTAMKLQPGESVDAIKPIKMTYRSMAPIVPLRLTSIAAMPEMGVKVWVLSDKRFGPANVPAIEIADEELRFDPNSGRNNYLPLVARKVDEAGGHGFITELAGDTQELAETIANQRIPGRAGPDAEAARDSLAEILRSQPYITRMYTRVSPEEMDIDPLFEALEGEPVSRVHVIAPPEDQQEQCNPAPVDQCEFVACGAGGHCAQGAAEAADNVAPGQAGCACVEGAVARAVPGDNGRMAVSCVDNRLNFAKLVPQAGIISLPDPCEGNETCGAKGECVSMNGTATCRCEAGFLAVIGRNDEGMPAPTCTAPAEPIDAEFFRRVLPEPNLPYPGRRTPVRGGPGGSGGAGAFGCSTAPDAPVSPAWLLLLAPLAIRLRRR